MDQLIDDFLMDCSLRDMAEQSVSHYGYCLKQFSQYLEGQKVNISRVDREVLKGFVEHMRHTKKAVPKTLDNYFSCLSSFYDYLVFEDKVNTNPIPPVRKRYLKRYKNNDDGNRRQLISVEAMAELINSTLDIRDKAVITLLAKTGIRRHELIELDLSDVDLVEMKIRLKPTHKRTNRTVFFDDEASFILRRWLKIREGQNTKHSSALFLNSEGDRLERRGIRDIVFKAALRVGLYNPESDRMEDHFSSHCCRHWFTTHLRRAGMRREFIQELRGDSRKEAIDIYDHIDLKELKEAYLAAIPQLGI